MNEASKEAYAASLEAYERLVATNPDIERKGAAMPYTSLNGHMFSFLAKDGKVSLRLPSESRDAFMKKYGTELSIQHGTVMKEYVVVPDALLRNTEELAPYFDESVRYVGTLKPKPTRKKTKAK